MFVRPTAPRTLVHEPLEAVCLERGAVALIAAHVAEAGAPRRPRRAVVESPTAVAVVYGGVASGQRIHVRAQKVLIAILLVARVRVERERVRLVHNQAVQMRTHLAVQLGLEAPQSAQHWHPMLRMI